MEISPFLLFRMTLASFFFGVVSGLFGDCRRFVQCLLGLEAPTGLSEWLNERGYGWLCHTGSPQGVWRRRVSSLLRFFGDLIWFVVFGVGMCLILYGYNRGRFRMLVPAAALLGVFLYRLLLHPWLSHVFSLMALLFRKALALVLRPFVVLLKGIGKFFVFLCKKLKLVLEKRKILRYNKNRKQGLLDEAEQGFLRGRDDRGAGKLFYETKIHHGDSR